MTRAGAGATTVRGARSPASRCGEHTSPRGVEAPPVRVAPRWVLHGPGEAQRVLRSGGCVVGRGPGCSLEVADPGVSRRHVRLLVKPTGVEIEDLGSRNGTFLDGHRVERCRVRGSVRLRIGETLLRLEPERNADEAAEAGVGLRVRQATPAGERWLTAWAERTGARWEEQQEGGWFVWSVCGPAEAAALGARRLRELRAAEGIGAVRAAWISIAWPLPASTLRDALLHGLGGASEEGRAREVRLDVRMVRGARTRHAGG